MDARAPALATSNRFRFAAFVLAALVACSRGEDPKARFTRDFVEAMRSSNAELKVEAVRDLEVSITSPGGGNYTSFLSNAYAEFELDPASRAALIERYVRAALESAQPAPPFDRTRIVPVIKDRAWIAEIEGVQKARGAKEPLQLVFDEYNEDLVVVYASDSPGSMKFVTPKELQASGLTREELRPLALENLRRILPKIELHAGPEFSMITAGGDYEASLLLFDDIWSGGTVHVEGDLLVSIPARDVLLVAGSATPGAVEALRATSAKLSKEAGHSLTDAVFVRRDGRFVRWKMD